MNSEKFIYQVAETARLKLIKAEKYLEKAQQEYSIARDFYHKAIERCYNSEVSACAVIPNVDRRNAMVSVGVQAVVMQKSEGKSVNMLETSIAENSSAPDNTSAAATPSADESTCVNTSAAENSSAPDNTSAAASTSDHEYTEKKTSSDSSDGENEDVITLHNNNINIKALTLAGRSRNLKTKTNYIDTNTSKRRKIEETHIIETGLLLYWINYLWKIFPATRGIQFESSTAKPTKKIYTKRNTTKKNKNTEDEKIAIRREKDRIRKREERKKKKMDKLKTNIKKHAKQTRCSVEVQRLNITAKPQHSAIPRPPLFTSCTDCNKDCWYQGRDEDVWLLCVVCHTNWAKCGCAQRIPYECRVCRIARNS